MENYNRTNTIKNYSINIDNMVYQKIMHWVNKATGEVSGLGKLAIDKNTGVITIKSAILLKQENTGSTTDIDAQAVGKAMFELRNEEGHLNFWWHSHVNMDVFWSGTDMDTIKQIGEQGFVVATVFNKKREMLSCLYRKSDELFPETFINEIPTQIVDHISPETFAEWDRDFEEKCKVKVYEPPVTTSNFADYHTTINNDYTDWYKNYKHNQQFDFGDDGEVLANDEAKIFAIQPEIDTLAQIMREQTQKNKARNILNKIMHKINNLKMRDPNKSYSLKKPYLDQYNHMFKGAL